MKPSKTQRAEWVTNAHDQHGVVDDLCACDSLIDAIFAAGVEAAHDGMTVEWGDPAVNGRPAGWTRRVTEWQAADDA